ncbi:hypothetical protein [Psychrobacter glacincola]|uniref:Uncharacterized protein n=1 Tax=Psychrobacter glacincola TaxID=56810 RepID=A0ABW1W933_9GAMM|nr:hypothetical protein [Psychrobacter glacincola]
MIKNICNSELFVPQKSKTTKLVLAIVVGAALLPLSAIATPMNDKEVDQLSKETIIDESKEKVTTITNSSEKKDSGKLDNDIFDSSVPSANTSNSSTNQPNAGNIENNDSSDGTNTGINNGTLSALAEVEARASDNTKEMPVEKQPEIAKKTPFWKNTNYLLSGGLIFLILGGALLSFLKISRLSDENEKLEQQNQRLRKEAGNTLSKLKQSNVKNAELESTLKQQLNINNDYKNSAIDTFGAVLPLMDMEEPLVIEDLDASDRKQLSDSITTWFQKNRGNMNISDLVAVEIQRKLDHWQYSIELWTQSDGVDSIELAQNTMRASVISLTKPDRQGFAYCYKKPNALSTVWVNKGWYKVQRTNSTLEVSGEPLEIN